MNLKPTLLQGEAHHDERGTLFYNNLDVRNVKRVYFIENKNTSIIRSWQGHKIEQRWFNAVTGSFKILLIKIENWENPTQLFKPLEFILKSKTLDMLHIPEGYISSIQALEESSKLMVMADYLFLEINDEYKYPQNYFENI